MLGGHADHLGVLRLVAPLAADLAARAHHVHQLLPAGGPAAHVTVLHLDGRAPRRPGWKSQSGRSVQRAWARHRLTKNKSFQNRIL